MYRARLSERGAQLAGNRTRGGLLPLRKERLFKPGGTVAVKASQKGLGWLDRQGSMSCWLDGQACGGFLPAARGPEAAMHHGWPACNFCCCAQPANHISN